MRLAHVPDPFRFIGPSGKTLALAFPFEHLAPHLPVLPVPTAQPPAATGGAPGAD